MPAYASNKRAETAESSDGLRDHQNKFRKGSGLFLLTFKACFDNFVKTGL